MDPTVSAPVPLRLRPLEVGDVLDETFRIYRRHFFLFAGISVILAIPVAGLQGYGFFALFNSFFKTLNPGQTFDFNSLLPTLGVLAVGYVVSLFLSPFIYGVVIYAVCESAQGRPVTFWGALAGVLRRYFPILGYVFLFDLMALFFCLFPLWTWIAVGWIAVLPVMFVENVGLGAAMGRSWRLVEGRWWRTFLIVFLIFIIIYAVRFALGAFIALGQGLLQLVGPILTQRVIDVALPTRDAGLAARAALLYAASLVLAFGCSYGETMLTALLGQRVMRDLRQQLFVHVQRLPIVFYDRTPVGRLVTRVTSDVESLNELFTAGVVAGLGDLFTLLAIAVMMIVTDWRLALASFAVIPLVYLTSHLFQSRVRVAYREIRARLARIKRTAFFTIGILRALTSSSPP